MRAAVAFLPVFFREVLLVQFGSLPRPELRVLDVSCGSGLSTFSLSQHLGAVVNNGSLNLVGCDADPRKLVAARRLFPSLCFCLDDLPHREDPLEVDWLVFQNPLSMSGEEVQLVLDRVAAPLRQERRESLCVVSRGPSSSPNLDRLYREFRSQTLVFSTGINRWQADVFFSGGAALTEPAAEVPPSTVLLPPARRRAVGRYSTGFWPTPTRPRLRSSLLLHHSRWPGCFSC